MSLVLALALWLRDRWRKRHPKRRPDLRGAPLINPECDCELCEARRACG